MKQRASTDLDGTRVHYVTYGHTGPRVLLVHAIGFDHTTWNRTAPALQSDFQLAALDLPGHGKSDKPLAVDYGPVALGARLIRFLDELGWEDAILVGNSLGGGASLAAAIQAPERVRGLALLNSIGFRQGLPPLGLLAFVPMVPVVGAYAPPVAVRLGLESCRSRWGSVTDERCTASREYLRDPEGRAAFFRALRQLYGPDLKQMARHYPDVHCPTLVVHGTKDPLIRFRHAERLAGTLPKGRLVPLRGCGHFPQEEAPSDVLRTLAPFLHEVGHRPAPTLPHHRPSPIFSKDQGD